MPTRNRERIMECMRLTWMLLNYPEFQIVVKEQIHKLRLNGRDFLRAGVYKIIFPFSFSYNLKIFLMSTLYLNMQSTLDSC